MTLPSLPIPALAAGVGLKPQHYKTAIKGAHGLDFFEVHAENFFGAGGPPHRWLAAFRAEIPLSIHGVCLSLGGRDALDKEHLARLADLVKRYQPALVSEHLAWSADDGVFFNDLLAPPLTETSLTRVADHVDAVQEAIGRQILIENPSSYLAATGSDMAEPAFLNKLAQRTGCGLLLDINNVFVSASNLGFDAGAYLDRIDERHVGEIHLAGHAIDQFDDIEIRVDDHGSRVSADVIALFDGFIRRAGPRPVLVEWDTDVPALDVLIDEAEKARRVMKDAWGARGIVDAA